MTAATLDLLLKKLHEEHEAATFYLNEGKMLSFEFWARQFHRTAELILALTGIDHRNRYA